MKRLLSVVLVLALVAYVGFKAAVWWYADRTLTEVRRGLADYGALERGQLGSGMAGELTLRGVRFQPFHLVRPVDAEFVRFRARSPLELVNGLRDTSSLPSWWELEFTGLALTLDSTLLRNWATDNGQAQPALFAPVCGPDMRQYLGAGDLMRMGIERLAGEALVYQRGPDLGVELATEGAGSIEVNWPGTRVGLVAGRPELWVRGERLHMTLRDSGLMRKITAYCARESGLEPSAWADMVTANLEAALVARGYEPSTQVRALYRQWLTEGGEISVELSPGEPLLGIPVREAGTAEADADELTLTYNNARVPDLYLTRSPPRVQAAPEQAMQPVVPGDTETAIAEWRDADADTAQRWLGRLVRVTLSSGREVEGRLDRVDDDRLEVARMLDGGEVTYPMTLRAIERLQIWHRGDSVTQ